jgi:SAM-dependent methyltransferase
VGEFSRGLIASSGYERPGFAETYDAARPRPPRALLDLLCRYAHSSEPVVVDLGCGTGLSTRAWSGIARRAIGVEPNEIFLSGAAPAPGVEYRVAFGDDTGLEDRVADIVTCSQSLHWMEPSTTFAEIRRILRDGGVFAAYDYDWPPAIDPKVDAAFVAYQSRRADARARRGLRRGGDVWEKRDHLARMEASGCFRFCTEVLVHSIEDGDAARVVGFARSLGLPVADETDATLEEELRIGELAAVAHDVLAERTVPFVFGYRVRIGVR